MLRNTCKTIVLATVLALVSGALKAQTDAENTGFVFENPADSIPRDTVSFNLDVDIAKQLLPIDSILEIAYINSPALKFESSMVESKLWDYRYTRVMFFQGVSAFYNYAVGNQTLIVTGSSPIDNAQISNGYRVGFNIQIPLSTLLGQGKKNKTIRAQVDAARHRYDQIKRELRQDILTVYVDMIEAQRKIKIRADDMQASFLTYKVAEEEMAEGKIPPSEYSRLRNIYAIAQTNMESDRASFLRAFYTFETLVGVDMRFLKKPLEQPVTPVPAPETPKK